VSPATYAPLTTTAHEPMAASARNPAMKAETSAETPVAPMRTSNQDDARNRSPWEPWTASATIAHGYRASHAGSARVGKGMTSRGCTANAQYAHPVA
jgi:hypothetical protein